MTIWYSVVWWWCPSGIYSGDKLHSVGLLPRAHSHSLVEAVGLQVVLLLHAVVPAIPGVGVGNAEHALRSVHLDLGALLTVHVHQLVVQTSRLRNIKHDRRDRVNVWLCCLGLNEGEGVHHGLNSEVLWCNTLYQLWLMSMWICITCPYCCYNGICKTNCWHINHIMQVHKKHL